MDGTRPQQPLTDSQVDLELEMALGVEPSPEFLARVRTRVAGEPELSSWRLAWWGRAVTPVTGAAMVGILLILVIPRLLREGPPAPSRPLATVAPQPSRTASSGDGVAKGQPQHASKAAPVVGRNRTHSLPLSDPLFSEDERRALALLVSAVEQGRVSPMPPAQADEERAEDGILTIEPLVLEPLPQLTQLRLGEPMAEGERE